MCSPQTNDTPTTGDVVARNMTAGTGPGRPARAGCGSGTWLDTPEGRRWENLTQPPKGKDRRR